MTNQIFTTEQADEILQTQFPDFEAEDCEITENGDFIYFDEAGNTATVKANGTVVLNYEPQF